MITNLTSDIGAAFDWIDLGSGADTVNVSALSGSVTINLQDLSNQTVTFGSAVLNLRNVEDVTTGGGDDIVYYPTGGAASTVSAGDGNDTFYLAGSGHTVLAGGGHDVLNLSSIVTGSRIDVGSGSALIRDSGSSSFDSIEEIIGGSGNDIMYGDGSGTTLRAGGGINYLEGSGSDILIGGSGDTYFSLSGGGTVISGAGNDYIEATGSMPVTIKFGVGSGHDMLGSYFSTSRDNSWIDERQYDLILLEGLTKNDIELIWNFTETGYIDYYYDDDPSSVVLNDWHVRTGEAAIRITSTGETLYLGELTYYYSYTGAAFYLYTGTSSQWSTGDRTISYDWDKVAEQAALNAYLNETYVPGPEGPHELNYGTWPDGIPADNNSDWWNDTIDFQIFSFDGVTKLDLFDLFDLDEVISQALPPEAKAAQDLLAQLGLGGDPGLIGGTSGADNLTGTGGGDDILGGAGSDTIDGGADNDFLRGGESADVLIGGAGDDDVNGGNGFDTASYSAAGGGVTVNLAVSGPQDTVGAGIDTLSSIESIVGSPFNDTLYGNSAANVLDGGMGDDVLDGGLGIDTLIGGAGNDTYYIDTAGDTIIESAGEGRDVVRSSISWALGDNLQRLYLTDRGDINGTGNALSNVIVGNSGANVVSGEDGVDFLYGGAGNDILNGGTGDDRLEGGRGLDQLFGGAGADQFVFRDGHVTGLAGTTCDMINDFSQSEGDVIRLDFVDANTGQTGDQSFQFIGIAGFNNVAGELRYEQLDGNTYLYGDTDGDGIADFMIQLIGSHALTEGDLVV